MPDGNEEKTDQEDLNGSQLADVLLSEQPAASPRVAEILAGDGEVVTVAEAPRNVPTSSHAGRLDADGVPFDPAVHCVDGSGEPRKRTNGCWRRKPLPLNSAAAAAADDAPLFQASPQVTDVHRAAVETVQYIIMAGCMIGGAEGVATEAEREGMIAGWETFYTSYGPMVVPPWMAPILPTGMYLYARLSLPKTGERLKPLIEWAKSKFSKTHQSNADTPETAGGVPV